MNRSKHQEPALIELYLRSVPQLFNSMDPSPFHERDLDRDAEQFILGWAREHSTRGPFKLLVHLERAEQELPAAHSLISEAVRNYFDYRAHMVRLDLRQLLREGRWALLVGVAFLGLCEVVAQFIPQAPSTWLSAMGEGLTIAGWVAMWKPVDIFLYRWWPLRQLEGIYRQLGKMTVEVKASTTRCDGKGVLNTE